MRGGIFPLTYASEVCGAWAKRTGTHLLKLGVLGLGLLQDGDVRVGVFPEGEEVFVGGEGASASKVGAARGFHLQGIRGGHAESAVKLTRNALPVDVASGSCPEVGLWEVSNRRTLP